MIKERNDKKLILDQAKKAFSLVEIIIVLFIISLGLVGILSLIVQNVQSQNYNKNNLIGYQLSQEGIELVRRERDSNWLKVPYIGFAYNMVPENSVVYSYCLDFNTGPSESSLSNEPCVLNLNSDYGFYIHDSSWPASNFSRLIKIELIENGAAMRVISEVYWQNSNGGMGSYKTEAILYDWYFSI